MFSPFSAEPFAFLFESAKRGALGRYSFFGARPFAVLRHEQGRAFLTRGARCQDTGRPLGEVVREYLKEYRLKNPGLSYPFLCGMAGYLGYELGLGWEGIRQRPARGAHVPDALLSFYDASVCFDHKTGEAAVFSSGFPEHGKSGKKRAGRRLEEILQVLLESRPSPEKPFRGLLRAPESNFTKKSYLAAVRKAKAYIAAGDIYQVNLSQKFSARTRADDWQIYKRLSESFPVCFSGFYRTPDFSIISASPERFLDFDGRLVSTRPMKGTRPRTGDGESDEENRRQLSRSRKEKAELLMVVDLERNDLGRVCRYGSVRLRRKRDIESYRTVFQATSEIEGLLHPSRDRWDLLKACFPGGSVTGCPKIRAMEIIKELEPDARGVYTGALGYMSFHNTLQFNILIRTLLKAGDRVCFHVGGGIVADSDPAREYEETLIKARVLLEALTGRQELL